MPNGSTLLTDADIEALPYMLTAGQAAEVCGIARRTLYEHARAGRVPAHVVGGVYRFAKPEVLQFAGLWWLIDRRYWERLDGFMAEAARIHAVQGHGEGLNGRARPEFDGNAEAQIAASAADRARHDAEMARVEAWQRELDREWERALRRGEIRAGHMPDPCRFG